MNKAILLFVCLSFTMWNGGSRVYAQDSFPLVPKPVEVNKLDGTFRLSSKTKISVAKSDSETIQLARLFAEQLEPLVGFKLEVSSETKKEYKQTIILKLNDRANASLGTEGYMLLVSPDKIKYFKYLRFSNLL